MKTNNICLFNICENKCYDAWYFLQNNLVEGKCHVHETSLVHVLVVYKLGNKYTSEWVRWANGWFRGETQGTVQLTSVYVLSQHKSHFQKLQSLCTFSIPRLFETAPLKI